VVDVIVSKVIKSVSEEECLMFDNKGKKNTGSLPHTGKLFKFVTGDSVISLFHYFLCIEGKKIEDSLWSEWNSTFLCNIVISS
jgi:hypothetical protein